ncbi:hypothetical protein [Aeromicrobium massiliense]|uniref:hypothetical protein n=1 Tax=Aeromicrobium massiliense TaxID=1464554 RepID=UPI0002E9868F|nr:hypothetical protein [Aeromicrobium massiliense]
MTRTSTSSSAVVLTLALSSAALVAIAPWLFVSSFFMNDSAGQGALAGPFALVALGVGLLSGVLSRVALKVPLVRAVVAGVLVAAAPPLVVGPVVALLTGGLTDLPAHVVGVAVLGGLAVLSFRAGRILLED